METGFRKNNLRPAYRAIKRLRGSTRSSANGSVARSDGIACATHQPKLHLQNAGESITRTLATIQMLLLQLILMTS